MAEGSSNQGIADRLVLTVGSVEKYVSAIFEKLDLPSTRSESRRVLAVLDVPPLLSPAGANRTPDTPGNPPPIPLLTAFLGGGGGCRA